MERVHNTRQQTGVHDPGAQVLLNSDKQRKQSQSTYFDRKCHSTYLRFDRVQGGYEMGGCDEQLAEIQLNVLADVRRQLTDVLSEQVTGDASLRTIAISISTPQ